MRKFKVQYAQVFEYEVEAVDLDMAARSAQVQVRPDMENGYIKIVSIEEIGSSRKEACADCYAKVFPTESRILRNWPKKVDKEKKKR
jgi:hypothetical protein